MENQACQDHKDPENMAAEQEVPVTGYSNAGGFSFINLLAWAVKVFVVGTFIFFAIVFGTCLLFG